MSPSSSCHKCQRELSALRIGAHWPTKIVCKSCRSEHYYRFGHLVGALYLTVLLPASLFFMIYAHKFANVKNGIYTVAALQYVVEFGGALLAFVIIAYIYGSIMKKCFRLQAKNP